MHSVPIHRYRVFACEFLKLYLKSVHCCTEFQISYNTTSMLRSNTEMTNNGRRYIYLFSCFFSGNLANIKPNLPKYIAGVIEAFGMVLV